MSEFFGSQFGQFLSATLVACAAAVLLRQLYGRISARHRRALDLSGEMRKIGFERIPKVLECYAIGDYVGAGREVEELHRILLDPAKRNLEFAQLFQRMLEHRLNDPQLRTVTLKLVGDLTTATAPPKSAVPVPSVN